MNAGGNVALNQLQELLRLRTAALESVQRQVVELSAELGIKRVGMMVRRRPPRRRPPRRREMGFPDRLARPRRSWSSR